MTETQNPKGWLKNISSLATVQIIGQLIPLVTFPIIVRTLGPEIYGKFVYAQTVVTFYGLIANPGLKTYGLREVAAHRENANAMISSILYLLILFGLLAYMMLGVSTFTLVKDRTTLLLILLFGLTLLFGSVFGIDWIFSAFQRFDGVAKLQLFSQLVFAIGVILFLRDRDMFWILPVLTCVGIIGAGLWGWYFLHREGIKIHTTFDIMEKWRIMQPSLFYGFSSLMASIFQRADHLMLKWLKGDIVLGQYGAGYRIMGFLTGFILIGTTVFVPYAANIAAKSPEEFRPALRKGLMILMAISIPITAGAAVLGRDIVLFILGPSYIDAGFILQVLSPVILLSVLSSFFTGSLLYAPGHHRRYVTAVTIAAIANMVGNVLLIPSLGGFGAAVATAVAQATLVVMAIYLGRRYLNRVFSRSLLHPFIATAAMLIVLITLSSSGVHIMVKIALGAFSYAIPLWILDRQGGDSLFSLLTHKKFGD